MQLQVRLVMNMSPIQMSCLILVLEGSCVHMSVCVCVRMSVFAAARRSLAQMRQLYFKMKDTVFKNERLGFSYDTDALEAILQEEFGELRMSDRDFPQSVPLH